MDSEIKYRVLKGYTHWLYKSKKEMISGKVFTFFPKKFLNDDQTLLNKFPFHHSLRGTTKSIQKIVSNKQKLITVSKIKCKHNKNLIKFLKNKK